MKDTGSREDPISKGQSDTVQILAQEMKGRENRSFCYSCYRLAVSFYVILASLLLHFPCLAESSILVVGSANADTFLKVARLPTEGENLTLLPGSEPVVDVPGGKGCTQAVAAAKLLSNNDGNQVRFVGQFGSDPAGDILKDALEAASVDVSFCGSHKDVPSGRGYVFLTQSGAVSAVVSGGSNSDDGWKSWKTYWELHRNGEDSSHTDEDCRHLEEMIDSMLDGTKCILLQREIPEYVNQVIASRARERGGIVVLQDVGGEDRSISREMLECCDFLVPNESELERLVRATIPDFGALNCDKTSDDDTIVSQAKALQKFGARNVLVTRGSRGSTLVKESGEVIHQPAFTLSKSAIVDETGAGDCYRAAFAVAMLEGHTMKECMKFASAAGSCSVEVQGAVPSTPSREQVDHRFVEETVFSIPRGDGQESGIKSLEESIPRGGSKYDRDFPFLIGSRLNSMKDRPELWPGPLDNPRHFVQRQATVHGLTCVDFNYPQHFHSWSNAEAKAALDEAGLVAGAVCLRYPSEFARGAMNHPDEAMRRKAIELTKQAAQTALDLGCNECVVWSAYDGYDYPFQVDYDEKWDQLVDAFRECCDAFPSVKFSLEYKPTDENTRFFTVPSTAAALQLVAEIDRPNMVRSEPNYLQGIKTYMVFQPSYVFPSRPTVSAPHFLLLYHHATTTTTHY